jgi:iron(III) transport system permease protein
VTPLAQSLTLATAVTATGLAVGWPAGVCCGLFRFTGRSVMLMALALPLLMPSFLWAIGLSMLRISLHLPDAAPFAGLAGCVWAQAGMAAGLAAFAALLSVRGITGSQAQAALLAGGPPLLWRLSLRCAFPAGFSAALLGGMMALSDSGAGALLGWRTAAGEILAAFAARYDFAEALRLCFWLALVAPVLTLPLMSHGIATLETAMTSRDSSHVWRPSSCLFGRTLGTLLAVVIAVLNVLPLAGLLTPVMDGLPLARAWQEVTRTAGNTLMYGLGAGLLATLLAWPLAVWTGQSTSRRRVMFGIMLALLALPPVLPALGWIWLAGVLPATLDGWLRGQLAVCLVLAWRFLPVAFVLTLRRWTAFSPSWKMAAAVHGVPWWTFFRRVVVPHQAPGWLLAITLSGLLACSEINIVLLLHPPGEASLPLAIFTVMANAPDTLVAALCLQYLAAVLPLACFTLRMSQHR